MPCLLKANIFAFSLKSCTNLTALYFFLKATLQLTFEPTDHFEIQYFSSPHFHAFMPSCFSRQTQQTISCLKCGAGESFMTTATQVSSQQSVGPLFHTNGNECTGLFCLFFNDYFRDGAASSVIQGMKWRSLMCFTLACLTFIFLTVNSAVIDCRRKPQCFSSLRSQGKRRTTTVVCSLSVLGECHTFPSQGQRNLQEMPEGDQFSPSIMMSSPF